MNCLVDKLYKEGLEKIKELSKKNEEKLLKQQVDHTNMSFKPSIIELYFYFYV